MTPQEALAQIAVILAQVQQPAAGAAITIDPPPPPKMGPVQNVVLQAPGGHAEAFGVGLNTFRLLGVNAGQRVDISTGDAYDYVHVVVTDPAGVVVCDFTAPAGAGSGQFVAPVPGDYGIAVDARDMGKINHWRS